MDNIEKENKRLKVLIVILLLVLLGFGGFYYYTTYVKGDDNDKEAANNEVNENNSNVEEENWVNYLLNAQNVKATLTKNTASDITIYEPTKRILNSDELSEYLMNLNKCECHNMINEDGFGGPDQYNVDISYTANDVEYSFYLAYGRFFFVTGTEKKLVDSKLIDLLTKDFPEEKKENPVDGNTHVFVFDYECAFQAIENFF